MAWLRLGGWSLACFTPEREAQNMKVLAGLIIIALLYAYLAVKTKAFLDGTVCDFEFTRRGCEFLSWIGAK